MPEIVTIILSDSQAELVAPLVRRAVENKLNVLFCAAVPDLGNWRMEAVAVCPKIAAKIRKLLTNNQKEKV